LVAHRSIDLSVTKALRLARAGRGRVCEAPARARHRSVPFRENGSEKTGLIFR
jgi:hypothetical protein